MADVLAALLVGHFIPIVVARCVGFEIPMAVKELSVARVDGASTVDLLECAGSRFSFHLNSDADSPESSRE